MIQVTDEMYDLWQKIQPLQEALFELTDEWYR